MPIYEYICIPCQSKFDLLRPMAQADAPTVCPEGHTGARRILSLVASFAREASGPDLDLAEGGGCACGNGACGCGDL